MIQDIDRPDVDRPAKMQAIADSAREALAALQIPYLNIRADDNLCSSVTISGSLDARETWVNGIFENSRHFSFMIFAKGRYYTPGDKVAVELNKGHHTLGKFRKSTGPADRAIVRVTAWITNHQDNNQE